MAIKKAIDKDGQLQVGITGEEQPVKGVILVGTDGVPYNASGGGGGGSSFDGQLTQGGNDVSATNPLPTGLSQKNIFGVYEEVSPTNPVPVRDYATLQALLSNGAPAVDAQMIMMGGINGSGNASKIPVGVEGTLDTMSFLPIGGVDESGNQKELEFQGEYAKTTNESIASDTGAKVSKVTVIGGHNGSNSYGWYVNANGQGKVINDSLGDPSDPVATTDTGTWSTPSLLKKLNQSVTSLLGRFGTLGQKAMSGSTPVVIASDQSSVPMTPRANGTGSGGTTFFKLISAGSTNASTVKTGAGNLYSIHAINTNASSVRYLKLYNKASNPTVGTDVPVATFAIPANSQGAGFTITFSMGPNFSAGIALAITAGVADNDTTAILANEVTITLTYA